MQKWNGKRVLILGAARQGLALARWLVRRGATVTVSDVKPEATLQEAKSALRELPIRWSLGGHPMELLVETDVLCLSGGVPASLPIVQEAARRGIPLSNDTQVFMEVVPCRTVGITGSAGKTTTTALVGDMARASFHQEPGAARDAASTAHPAAYVGGNLGDPLLNYVDDMQPADLAILEISSFQLEQMSLAPNVAAILNVTPNHLDRHKTMEAYVAAKARILDFQTGKDTAVLGRDDPGAWNLRSRVRGKLISFGRARFEDSGDGTYYDDGLLYLSERGVDIPLVRRDQIALRGEHNVLNVLAAFAIGLASGLSLDHMLAGAESFRGVAHRLELVREWRGTRWYDDSIATAPERVIAAVHAFDEPLVLLLGGRDKDLPWENLARLVHRRVDHAVLFGEAAGKIEKALREAAMAEGSGAGMDGEPARLRTVDAVGTLQQAVQHAGRIVEPGDVVLLAPGGTSFDEFRDFEERGASFRQWVQELS